MAITCLLVMANPVTPVEWFCQNHAVSVGSRRGRPGLTTRPTAFPTGLSLLREGRGGSLTCGDGWEKVRLPREGLALLAPVPGCVRAVGSEISVGHTHDC